MQDYSLLWHSLKEKKLNFPDKKKKNTKLLFVMAQFKEKFSPVTKSCTRILISSCLQKGCLMIIIIILILILILIITTTNISIAQNTKQNTVHS